MLHNRLESMRMSHGLTQQALADRVGISIQLVALIENRPGYYPTARMMEKICRYFDIPLGWMFWLDGAPVEETPEAVDEADPVGVA